MLIRVRYYENAETRALFVGIYLVFVTIMCFLSVGMTIVVIHLFTNSIAVIPIRMSDPVSGSQHVIYRFSPHFLSSFWTTKSIQRKHHTNTTCTYRNYTELHARIQETIQKTTQPHQWLYKVTVDSRGGGKFKNNTLHKWIKHMHYESVIKCRIAVATIKAMCTNEYTNNT